MARWNPNFGKKTKITEEKISSEITEPNIPLATSVLNSNEIKEELPKTQPKIIIEKDDVSEDNSPVRISRLEYETLMQRMALLEKEDSELLSMEKPYKRYSWPKSYSFKIMDWYNPICHLKMVSNKISREISTWGWKEDQRIEVTYPDWSTEQMLFNDYVQQFSYSEKTIPIKEKHNIKIYFIEKLKRKPEVLSKSEFNSKYMTVNEQWKKVINYDIINKIEELSYYTFRIENKDEDWKYMINEWKEFTVNQTAIN